MKPSSFIDRVFQQEHINFVLTNKIPRRLATRFVGWFSRIENSLVRDLSLRVWTAFAGDLNLHESRKTSFTSLHDCFIRELKDGARPIDGNPRVLVSPCDAIVGACGRVLGTELLQAKGFVYTLNELLADPRSAPRYVNGHYITLRLASNMYHRFHAPYGCAIDSVTYIAGDRWNVNPIAVRRIPRLYCRNERAVIHARLDGAGDAIALVAVGAILVTGIHLNFLEEPLVRDDQPIRHIPCRASFKKGDEVGYFHHGSTIILIATGELEPTLYARPGQAIRMGQPLLLRR